MDKRNRLTGMTGNAVFALRWAAGMLHSGRPMACIAYRQGCGWYVYDVRHGLDMAGDVVEFIVLSDGAGLRPTVIPMTEAALRVWDSVKRDQLRAA